MPSKKINELTSGTPTTTDELPYHAGDDYTYRTTVADLLSNITYPVQVPAESLVYDNTNDKVVIADDSNGGEIRGVDPATFLAGIGVVSSSGSVSGGDYKLGDLEIKFGVVQSTGNSAEVKTFSTQFTTDCVIVVAASMEADAGKPINCVSFSQTGFTLNRDFASSGTFDVAFIALGY